MKNKLAVILGWFAFLSLPFNYLHFANSNEVMTKWGRFSGKEGLDAFIGLAMISLIGGWYSISETLKYFKGKKNK